MPRINLLPWRDQQRRDRKLAFFVALGGAALLAGLAAFIAYLLLGSMIDAQEHRNDRLRAQIKILD
jgi:type IV pilus assembly protein PilN